MKVSRGDAFEAVPWGHCDQIFVKRNFTFSEGEQNFERNFINRQEALEKLAWWPFAPPHMTKVPIHLWEFEVNKEMWVQKTRLMRKFLS